MASPPKASASYAPETLVGICLRVALVARLDLKGWQSRKNASQFLGSIAPPLQFVPGTLRGLLYFRCCWHLSRAQGRPSKDRALYLVSYKGRRNRNKARKFKVRRTHCSLKSEAFAYERCGWARPRALSFDTRLLATRLVRMFLEQFFLGGRGWDLGRKWPASGTLARRIRFQLDDVITTEIRDVVQQQNTTRAA